MKKIFKTLVSVVIAASIMFNMLACGGSDPKSLAKQTYDVSMELSSLWTSMNDSKTGPVEVLEKSAKMEGLMKKRDALKKKADNLSPKNSLIYAMELIRLTEEGKNDNKNQGENNGN